jgi:hypothetical protein
VTTVLGIDPGARSTGLCVLSDGEILAHQTVTSEGDIFPTDRLYVLDVLAVAEEILTDHKIGLVAVETIIRPNWHMNGRAAADPTALLATAEVLGAIKGHHWPVDVVQIRPNKNGSRPLGAYPDELISPAERRKKGWEHRIGGGQLRHARSAYDVARLASSKLARNFEVPQEKS